MAKIKKPPVPAEMYRHFAIITVLLTAALAMIAQGENKQFHQEQEAAQAQTRSANFTATSERGEESDEATPAYGEAKLSRRDGAESGGFANGPEFDRSYGRSSGPAGSRFSSQIVPAQGSENAGFTASYLDKLSEEELQRLLDALREDGIESETERMQATAVLEAASRRRSGHRIPQG